MEQFGIQLYSVRDTIAGDVPGTLAQLAQMGYTGVEFAGYYDMTAADMKAALDSAGLTAMGSHVPYDRLTEHLDEELEYNLSVGNKYLICPGTQVETADDARRAAETLERCAEKCAVSGAVVGYHNHAHELKEDNGAYLLDIMREETQRLVFELDLYWVRYALDDVAAYMRRYDGRLPLVHLKQIAEDKENVVFGRGILDFASLVPLARELGAQQFIVEHESYGDGTPMECVRSDAQYLLSLACK